MQPGYAAALCNKGKSLVELGLHDEALAAYEAAIGFRPDLLESWIGLGDLLHKLKRHREAANAFARALELQPRYLFLKGILLHQRLLACDWRDIEASIAEIERDLQAGRLAAEPFPAVSDDACARCGRAGPVFRAPTRYQLPSRRIS